MNVPILQRFADASKSKKNVPKIRSLMEFYKKAYQIIAIIIMALGLLLLPVLPHLIKGDSGIEYLSIIYVIYLFNMAVGYLFSYKRTLITSDQRKYKIMPFIMAFNIITTVLQMIVLLIFHNYIIYLWLTFCLLISH